MHEYIHGCMDADVPGGPLSRPVYVYVGVEAVHALLWDKFDTFGRPNNIHISDTCIPGGPRGGARVTDTTYILIKVYMFRKQINLEGLEKVHA